MRIGIAHELERRERCRAGRNPHLLDPDCEKHGPQQIRELRRGKQRSQRDSRRRPLGREPKGKMTDEHAVFPEHGRANLTGSADQPPPRRWRSAEALRAKAEALRAKAEAYSKAEDPSLRVPVSCARAGARAQHSTRIISDRVMMNVLSVLKSRTRTAGFCGVIIVARRSTGVEASTNGNAGCMIASTGFVLTSGSLTNSE